MEKIIEKDHELFLWLNKLGNESWDPFWLAVTDKWTAIPLYAVLVFLIFKKFGWKSSAIILVFIALLITATDQLANVFKHGFERPRPCGQEGIKEYARFVAVRCGRFGFFSAHASNSFGVAIFLGILFRKYYKNLIWFLLIWAALVAYSRIYLGVHYPGDIVVGAAIGSLLALIFLFLLKLVLKRFNPVSQTDKSGE